MKFTFKRTGYYTWAMGNKTEEKGSFFKIDNDNFDINKIIRDYGCSITSGGPLFGTNYSDENYLFIPENVYPIMKTMFKEIQDFFHSEHEKKMEEKRSDLEKLKQWIDPELQLRFDNY